MKAVTAAGKQPGKENMGKGARYGEEERMLDVKTYLILVVLMAVVTGVRAYLAHKRSMEQQEADKTGQADNEYRMSGMANTGAVPADLRCSTAAASVMYDPQERMLLCVLSSGESYRIPREEIREVRVFDHSAAYQHSLEMERLHRGVERVSLYNPYGRHKISEVRNGHKEFERYQGFPVYGLDIQRKNDPLLSVPFFRGNSSLFWTEKEHLEALRTFAENLRKALAAG